MSGQYATEDEIRAAEAESTKTEAGARCPERGHDYHPPVVAYSSRRTLFGRKQKNAVVVSVCRQCGVFVHLTWKWVPVPLDAE